MLKKFFLYGFTAMLILAVALSGCGGGGGGGKKDDSTPNPPNAPSIPQELTSEGSLNHIFLQWKPSSGNNLIGYNIYRSEDGVNFTRINGSTPITDTSYDDQIDSSGNGKFYYYRVTAVGDAESGFSNVTKNIHGTRIPQNNPGSYSLAQDISPYIAEGTIRIDGHFWINAGTELYVLDDCTISIGQPESQWNKIWVNGLLRVLASPERHATFTAHPIECELTAGIGLRITFGDTMVDYNPVDGSGTVIQNTLINNLGNYGSIEINSSSPKYYNSNIRSISNMNSFIYLSPGSAIDMSKCRVDNLCISINTDLNISYPSFKICHNIFNNRFFFQFGNLNNPGVANGQIENNYFHYNTDSFAYSISLYNMTGGPYSIPLGNNYWDDNNYNPWTPHVGSDNNITVDFSEPLTSPPPEIATIPNWL
jgi:hypothetical protein